MLLSLPLVNADGDPATTTTPVAEEPGEMRQVGNGQFIADFRRCLASTLSFLTLSLGCDQVCSSCDCGGEWLGSQSLESCAAACFLKSSHVQHASGTRFDGDPGAETVGVSTRT